MWSFGVVLLIIYLFMSHMDFTMAVSSWNMHDLCGTNLDINEDAGKLRFDADEFPVNLTGNTCSLAITSSSTLSTNMMIMFYFTQFMFSDSCDDSNVTFINGTTNNNNNNDVAPGLSVFVCGNNNALAQNGVYFTTSGKNLKIVFNKSQLKSRNVFTVVLVPYYVGSCLSDTVHECSNGRCIFVNNACLDEINSCGNEDLNCNTITQSPKSYTDDITTQSPNSYTEDTTTESPGSYPAFLSPQLAAACGFFLLVLGSFIVAFFRSEQCSRLLFRIKRGLTSIRESCCSCCYGTCQGFRKCFGCIGTICGRCSSRLRTNWAGLCTRCAGPSAPCTNSPSCSRSEPHQEEVDNQVDRAATLQFYPEQPIEQLPPSYETVTRYQSGSEFDIFIDSHPAPSAPSGVYLSVEDPPPSYDDVISREHGK